MLEDTHTAVIVDFTFHGTSQKRGWSPEPYSIGALHCRGNRSQCGKNVGSLGAQSMIYHCVEADVQLFVREVS